MHESAKPVRTLEVVVRPLVFMESD
jgi:hypothetical protein